VLFCEILCFLCCDYLKRLGAHPKIRAGPPILHYNYIKGSL
jgi:hypothetical protein